MNTSKQFLKVYNNVKCSLFWKDFNGLDSNFIKYIEKKEKITFLQESELQKNINTLLDFNINLIWDKQFWKLKSHESICAVASEKSSFLKKLRSQYNKIN